MAQKQAIVKGKKEWRQIVAPRLFKDAILGETLVYEAEQMKGKRIHQNLMNLSNDVKRQNISITFEVTSVKDGKGYTEVVAYTMIPSSIRRMVRRRSDRVDLSFACLTSDNRVVRIKPMLVTRGNTTSVIHRKVHHMALDFVLKAVKGLTYEQLLTDLVSYKFQSELRGKINKTYPLKSAEVRALVLVKEGTPANVLAAPEVAEAPAQEPAVAEAQ